MLKNNLVKVIQLCLFRSGPGFVKLSGMVWTVSEEDIIKFLHDCSVKDIRLIDNEEGKPSGTAVVKLASKE